MSETHAFGFLVLLWAVAWAIIGFFDPDVSALFGLAAGVFVAVCLLSVVLTFEWLLQL